MSEKEFIESARQKGVSEENIIEYINTYNYLLKKNIINGEIDASFADIALKSQITSDNSSDNIVSLD